MDFIRQSSSFILLILFQVLILNNILFQGYLNPYVYIMFVLMLPLNMDRGYVLILAFLMGLSMDIFENSGGVHVAATVLLAYSRRWILKLATRKQGQDFEEIQIKRLSVGNMIVYFSVAIFLHHFVLFLIESYSFRDIGTILARTVISGIFTSLFVLLIRLWRLRKKD